MVVTLNSLKTSKQWKWSRKLHQSDSMVGFLRSWLVKLLKFRYEPVEIFNTKFRIICTMDKKHLYCYKRAGTWNNLQSDRTDNFWYHPFYPRWWVWNKIEKNLRYLIGLTWTIQECEWFFTIKSSTTYLISQHSIPKLLKWTFIIFRILGTVYTLKVWKIGPSHSSLKW